MTWNEKMFKGQSMAKYVHKIKVNVWYKRRRGKIPCQVETEPNATGRLFWVSKKMIINPVSSGIFISMTMANMGKLMCSHLQIWNHSRFLEKNIGAFTKYTILHLVFHTTALILCCCPEHNQDFNYINGIRVCSITLKLE